MTIFKRYWLLYIYIYMLEMDIEQTLEYIKSSSTKFSSINLQEYFTLQFRDRWHTLHMGIYLPRHSVSWVPIDTISILFINFLVNISIGRTQYHCMHLYRVYHIIGTFKSAPDPQFIRVYVRFWKKFIRSSHKIDKAINAIFTQPWVHSSEHYTFLFLHWHNMNRIRRCIMCVCVCVYIYIYSNG